MEAQTTNSLTKNNFSYKINTSENNLLSRFCDEEFPVKTEQNGRTNV